MMMWRGSQNRSIGNQGIVTWIGTFLRDSRDEGSNYAEILVADG
jgi:hypothetical protein